jgi:hypothetical protein
MSVVAITYFSDVSCVWVGATIAANNGATAYQLMAIFGWDTIKEAEMYTAKADQHRLAASATM